MQTLKKNFSFVKAETITTSKVQFLKEFKESVQEIALAKKGKLKLHSAKDFLNEL